MLLASGSMTAAVDRVESMGLVIRKTTAKDRRARVLELTPKGRRLIERAFARARAASRKRHVGSGRPRKSDISTQV